MVKISKFINLEKFLITQDKSSIKLSFSEIETIIDDNLCPSAYKYKPYWNPSKTHTLPNLIIDCGYNIVSVDLENKFIILHKKK